MLEETVARPDQWLRQQLAEDPPVPLKLLDGDVVLGTLVRVEARDGEDGEWHVAILGEVDLADVADAPELDGDQFVSLSLSHAAVKRRWEQLDPKPGERVGFRRIGTMKGSKGRDFTMFTVAVYRYDGDGRTP
jgi:hypothetical protein